MDVNMTETEQMQMIKDWWNKNGKMILAVIVLALAGNFGWSFYKKQNIQNAEFASQLYNKMLVSYYQKNTQEFKANAEYLANNYPKAPYANFANFGLAKQAIKDGKLDEAVRQLDFVIKKNHTPRFVQIARIRKARVLLAQDKIDAALATLAKVEEPTFMPLVNEVRGDIFVAKGDHTKARKEYQAALKAMPINQSNRTILQMKFDQLAGPENGIA